MKYSALKAIISSNKQPIPIQTASDSFFHVTQPVRPFIEPTFTKEEYPKEKPAIILVSAVAASGKTTTAHALAFDLQLPVLDLAKHKPVGDNTLTGILTSAYPIASIGLVLEGLTKGTHGIIIDGIDEGRSKTTERGFEAFLDDIIKLTTGAASTSLVILGRSQALLSTWCYLAERGVDVAMLRIDPFNLERAKSYIDAYLPHIDTNRRSTYEQARDEVLQQLGAAFADSNRGHASFLDFLGYPPVLDAVATLLRSELNYYRINQALNNGLNTDLEVDLLIRIASYLLRRERNYKAVPNFITPITSKADPQTARQLKDTLYDELEQCARVLARALNRPFPRTLISDIGLNHEYEEAVAVWCEEHPFLNGSRIRNAVFESVAVSRCARSSIPEYQELAYDYTTHNRPTYHLIRIMRREAGSEPISCKFLNMLIQSCSDFIDKEHDVAIELNGISWDDPDHLSCSTVELEVEVASHSTGDRRVYIFCGTLTAEDNITLGPLLLNISATLPCDVTLHGHQTIESLGTCRISARNISLRAPELAVRGMAGLANSNESGIFLDVDHAQGHVATVSIKGGCCEIMCTTHELTFPLAQYVRKIERNPADPDISEKFRRLRRILMEFASHRKGGLAKYRDKIEHERVLRGKVGRRILDLLLKEGVLREEPKFYLIDAEKLAKVLGTTWLELRHYKMSKRSAEFLRRIT